MRIVQEFPHAVETREHIWIPMPDGCRLAARVWLPANAEREPIPAIIEYIPYRKTDGTRLRDEPMHGYFAGHGYASLRIDLRGSGESDGLLVDEYLEQEQQDGVDAIRWIASQPWCNGVVGMIGKSWGGFNALQVAALAPPELKAIITVCSTDDRYADDAHYMGGCLLNENLIWGSVLMTLNALPADPALVGDGHEAMWRDRIRNVPLYPQIWLEHQLRDVYWKQGSVCEDFSRITCAVYTVGGWADGYTNAVPRLLAGLSSPRKGLVGPWAHVYPHEGVPGPAIGFLQEALRWWDYWLKGIDTGIMREPMYRAWMQESIPPSSSHASRPGRWVAEPAWPPPDQKTMMFHLSPGRLAGKPGAGFSVRFRSPLVTGLDAGTWCGFGDEGEMPADQRADDGKSLVFDTDPLPERVEILGAPVVTLDLASSTATGLIAVRLNDVTLDGSSSRVTYGLLNLTHREGNDKAVPLEPGRKYRVRLPLGDTAHAFPAGHRIRLALSTSYWPVVWPSPDATTLTLHSEGSTLALPVRPPRPEDDSLRPFEAPEAAPAPETVDLGDDFMRRDVRRDLVTGEAIYTVAWDLDDDNEPVATRVEAIDLETGHGVRETFRIREGDPLSARAEIIHRCSIRRGGWNARVETSVSLSGTAGNFHLEAAVEARQGDRVIATRCWNCSIPRTGV